MIIDPYESTAKSAISPSEDCFAIVPDDDADLPRATKSLYVGTGGDIVLKPVDSDGDTLFANVPNGAILPVRVQAVRSSGTTASDIVGLA